VNLFIVQFVSGTTAESIIAVDWDSEDWASRRGAVSACSLLSVVEAFFVAKNVFLFFMSVGRCCDIGATAQSFFCQKVFM
jgi:hypothetical protein